MVEVSAAAVRYADQPGLAPGGEAQGETFGRRGRERKHECGVVAANGPQEFQLGGISPRRSRTAPTCEAGTSIRPEAGIA